MTVIEIMQGHYRGLDGTPKDQALAMFARNDAEFVEKYPDTRAHFRPAWREIEVPEDRKAPWGHEWYRVEDGVLRMHSAHYDSSG